MTLHTQELLQEDTFLTQKQDCCNNLCAAVSQKRPECALLAILACILTFYQLTVAAGPPPLWTLFKQAGQLPQDGVLFKKHSEQTFFRKGKLKSVVISFRTCEQVTRGPTDKFAADLLLFFTA